MLMADTDQLVALVDAEKKRRPPCGVLPTMDRITRELCHQQA